MPSSVKSSICHGMAFRVFMSIICLCTLLFQGGILNYYLVMAYGAKHWAWWVADAAIFAIFVAAFVLSFRSMKIMDEKNVRRAMANQAPVVPGELPMGYMAWICYSIILSVRVWLLFWQAVQELKETDVFGPNLLKITIGLSCFVFLLLVNAHHDSDHGTSREAFIKQVVSGVTFDLLDTIAILEVLFINESHVFLTFALHRTILVIACLNITLPTLPLLVLSKTRYGRINLTKTFHVVHHLIYLMLINVPLFVIRMILWHVKSTSISVFLLKNLLSIAFSIRSLVGEFAAAAEERENAPPISTEMAMMHAAPATTRIPDSERETDPSISEAATLPIRHRSAESSDSKPRFV